MSLSPTHLPEKFLTLAERMNISEQGLERRKQFLQFGPEEERLRKLAPVSDNYPEAVIEAFYQHLVSIRANRAKVIVIDITGVATVDSRVANHLVQTVDAARLMGAQVVIDGIQPEIAFSMVQPGLDLKAGIALLKAADTKDGARDHGR